MKHALLFVLILFILTGCVQGKDEADSQQQAPSHIATENTSQTSIDENPQGESSNLENYIETFPDYSYAGETEATFNDRHFKLEDVPENLAEELVAENYYYDIAGEFDKLGNVFGENEALQISAANTQKNYQEGVYIKDLVVKNLSVIKKDELNNTQSPAAFSLEKDVTEYGLTEFTVIRAEISMAFSQKALSRGSQLGDGDYTRSFLCGKNKDVNEWKIYEVYWE